MSTTRKAIDLDGASIIESFFYNNVGKIVERTEVIQERDIDVQKTVTENVTVNCQHNGSLSQSIINVLGGNSPNGTLKYSVSAYNGPHVKTTSRKFIVNTTTYFVS